MPAGSAVFVDTNVFLYAMDRGVANKQSQALEWRAALWKSRRGRTSFQVLQELYVNAVHKQLAARAAARAEARDLLAWRPVSVDGALLEDGWKIQERFGLSFWDAMILAAAKRAACRFLLTEDLQDNQELDGVRILSPFTHTPDTVLAP